MVRYRRNQLSNEKLSFLCRRNTRHRTKCKHCFEWFKAVNSGRGKVQFGEGLRNLRQRRNLYLVELAKLSGVQSATLSRMENNKAIGSLKNYQYIASALGLKLSELFAEMDK